MKGVEFAEVRDAIARAFNSDEFDMFLFEKLNFDRGNEVADGPFKVVVSNVLKQFEREGRDPFLIAAVAEARPLKTDVQEVYKKYAHGLLSAGQQASVQEEQLKALERYGLMPSVILQRGGQAQLPSATPATQEGFQRIVRRELPNLNPRIWGAGLMRNEVCVCQIEVDRVPLGTGFLVGPEAVLTNYHVIGNLIESSAAGNRITCLFDYRIERSSVESEGTRVGVKPTFAEWHLDSSPPLSDDQEHAGVPMPTKDQLDHALIRLERPLGDEPIFPTGPTRGWIRVPDTAPVITEHMPILILQHPKADPIKLAMDTDAVRTFNSNRTRVRYATNTERGSSGSPCFNIDWRLIALHHYGESGDQATAFNQGIPVEAIRERLTRQTKTSFLGSERP
jgi:hypothetical protein